MAVRHHVRDFGNNKIIAIKLVRSLTGCGLREAKDTVEGDVGFFVTATSAIQAQVAVEAARYGIRFDPPLDGTVADADPTEVAEGGAGSGWSVRFLGSPRLIEAIKLVREVTGLGLKESKQIVDELGLVRTELDRFQAEAIAARFAAISAKVELIAPVSLSRPVVQALPSVDDW